MTDVLLATSGDRPGGEPAHELLDAALVERGITARWAVWDDPSVDWADARLVAVRSTWDYTRRPEQFLDWARKVEAVTTLLNGADVFAWNHDKRYLTELDGLPVVPTRLAGTTAELAAAVEEWGRCVVKPRVGAGGAGVWVADPGGTSAPPTDGPWLVQPLVESVRTTGEASVFVFGGPAGVRVGDRVDKVPAADQLLVHTRYGGTYRSVPAEEATTSLARRAMDVVAERLGRRMDYGRVDMMRSRGGWLVSEVELIEPGLYLDVVPGPAEAFADMVAARLGAG